MENYNSFIELLKRFELKQVSINENKLDNEDSWLYNGFPCDNGEAIENYLKHLRDLYDAAFVDIKRTVDTLLVNNTNTSMLNIFFRSKIDDLTEIAKIIEERDNRITEEKINNSAVYHEMKDSLEDSNKSMLEMMENLWRWNRYEELYYRGEMTTSELCEIFASSKNIIGANILAKIIIEKEQRDLIKSTKERMNELYGIYCPKQNEVKEEKQSKINNFKVEKDFEYYLHHDNKEALMLKLHELLDDKKGKVVAITIKALEQLGFISVTDTRSAIYKAMRKEFGEIGSDQSINPIMNNFTQYDSEIEQQKRILKEVK